MFKWFRRPDPPKQVIDIPLADYTAFVRRQAVLEATLEALEMKWVAYRDELKRLVNRLEKRDSRAEAKELEVTEGEVAPRMSDLRQRRLRRRRTTS